MSALKIAALAAGAVAVGVAAETVYFYRSPAYARRGSGKNRMVVIRVED